MEIFLEIMDKEGKPKQRKNMSECLGSNCSLGVWDPKMVHFNYSIRLCVKVGEDETVNGELSHFINDFEPKAKNFEFDE